MKKFIRSLFYRNLFYKLSLFLLLFFCLTNVFSQTTEEFNSSPTLIEYPGVPQWKTTAEVSIDGIIYQLTGIINGSWSHSNNGGVGNSPSLYAESAGDLTVTLKRKDGQNFQFYGLWLKYTNFNTYPSPYLKVNYNGSGLASEIYGLSSTVNLNKDINVSSVTFSFSGLWKLNVDNLIVGSGTTLPELSTASASVITTDSAVLGGKIIDDGGSAIIDRGIVWSTTSNSDISDNKIQMGSGSGNFSGKVNSLPANTKIYTRAYAVNGKGISYGSEKSFTTLVPQLKNFSWSADNLTTGATGVTYTFSYTTETGMSATTDAILYALQPSTSGWNTENVSVGDISVTINGNSRSVQSVWTGNGFPRNIVFIQLTNPSVPAGSKVIVSVKNVINNSDVASYPWSWIRTATGGGNAINEAVSPEPIVLVAPTATGSITITENPSDPTSDWLLSEGKLIPLVDGAKVNVNEVIDALASGDLIIEAETDVIIDANITPSLLENRTLTLKANRDINLEDNSSIVAKDFSLNTILWSDADALAGGVAYLKNQAEIFTHGGHLWIGGGSGSTVWNGLIVGNSTAVGNTNNSNGISLIKTNINTDGGNIAFYGRGLSGSIAGTPTPISTGNSTNTNGIRMHDGNFINAGSGTIYMYGFADNSYGSSNVNGVELSHTPGAPDLITSSNNTENAIFIEGYAQGPATVANSWGFYTHLSTIENTGGGTIHIKGSAVRNSGVTVAQNGAVLANSGKIILEGTGAGGTNPNVLVQGAIGKKANSNVESSNANIEIIGDRFSISGNAPNGRIQSSGILSLRPYTSGIDIGLGSASGTLEIPASYFQDNFVNGFSEIIIGDEQTGNITVGGTIVYKDLLTIKTNKNIVLTSDANMSSATANALTLWSRAGGDNEANDTNFGAIWMQQGSSIHTGGGNLTMGGGSNPYIGFAMGDPSSRSAENNAIYRGIAMNGSIDAVGGNIIINGKGSSNITNTRGVNIAGPVVTVGAGDITVRGIGRGTSDAIAMGDGYFNPAAIGILKTDTGTINLDGKPSSSSRNGLNISTSGSYIRTNGNFSVTTTGRITATAGALNVGGSTHLEAADNITMTHTTNDFFGPMVVNVASNLQLTDQNEVTLGEISVSGTIEIATLEGDLTISENISTTNATADAIQIFAGKNKIAGNPLGGSIKINGTPEVTTGTGGQAKLYSGAILQSADLISLTGEENTRYNVDANTSTFDPVLGSGNYALIREKKNDPSTATNVSISGVLIVEEELTGTYDYNDSENEPESGTTYQWYRADDSNGTNQSTIVGADGITYVLSQEDVGKFISFEVTPNDGIDPGVSVESNLMGPVADILSASISSSTNVSCNGGSDGSVTVSVTGGIEPYKYSWNDPSGSTIATVENLSAGTYKVTITDNQNQETTASVTITQPEIYEADDPSDVVACDSYTLPDLISGSYFSENNGDGVEISAGSEITESQTLYVYGENTNGCTDQNEFKITINKNDVSGVSFTDKEVVYNGNLHTLAVSGLPEGASVDYNVSNSYTHSGSYTIKATISSAFESCPDRELEATLTIKKAEATITAETTQIFTYDGTVKNVAAILNHSETELSYTPQQGYTDAGTYPITISAEETDNYLSVSKEVSLVTENAEIEGVTFESETFTYDGTSKDISITGLPEGATVKYANNGQTNAGTYKVTVTISQENFNDKVLTADLVIKKAEAVITADAIQMFTYDGIVKDVSATLNQSETQLTYTPQQGYINAGTYPVTISTEETDNYLSALKEVSLVIDNAEIEGVTFEGDTFIYDGTTKSIAVTGLPKGATVTYENNEQINAGTYKVTATVSQENYNDKILTADLVINKAEAIVIADATQTFTYDGIVKDVSATLNHSETELIYAPVQGYTNAGTYPVIISSEETDNYLSASKEVSLVIENAEIEGVAFEGDTFIYDGTTKSIAVIGLPEGATVTYTNNRQINAGTYKVTATVSQENYNNKILTADLSIEKAETIITAEATQTFTYDGTVKDVEASLNHSETQLAYAPQQGYTNAGTYPVRISSKETDNYLSASEEVSLVIENAEIEGVTFEDGTFTYDGETHSLAVTGLSEGATVNYENNDKINAGSYKVTAIVSQENYNDKILTADLVINKAEAVITADAAQTFTYDGTVKNVAASLNHSETQLTFTPQQGYINAGTYSVTITSEETDNYLSASKEVSLVIENAEIEGITFEGDTFIYDGTTKSIEVTGLPEGATVKYENNGQINAGTYKVTATVIQENYNDKILTADLVINKAEAVITADAIQTFTYDGAVKGVAATLNHSETELAYAPAQGYTASGTYPVIISAEETDNYLSVSKEASLVIENAEIEGVTFESETFTYDGTSKDISITGLPEGATVKYENNGQTNAGTYKVTVTISQENYNDKVLTADLVINKAEAIITADAIQTFTYDGTVKNISAELNHEETALTYASQQGYTNAGTYKVTVASEETANYLPTSKEVSLVIENAEIEGVTFEGGIFTYDGTTKNISIAGPPEGATVKYADNGQINAGSYQVTATISKENFNDKVLTADLVINKAEAVITTDAIQTFTYDGTVKDVTATLNHSETELTYAPAQGYTASGTYPVIISAKETDNYLSVSKEVSLVIENAEIAGVSFDGEFETFTFDGSEHSIFVTGLPEGATVEYNNNTHTNAGTYIVTATVSLEGYEDLVLTTTLVIKKAEQEISFNELEDLNQLSDEYLQLEATSTSGLPVIYSYTYETEDPAATVGPRGFVRILGGGQITITATQEGSQNYEAANPVVRTLTINGSEALINTAVINGVTYSNPGVDIYYLIGCENSENEVQIELEQNRGSTIDRDNIFTMSTPAPGIYKETVIVTSEDGNLSRTYNITVEKNFNFEDIVIQKFNNVLLVNNNPETNGGYKFVSYRWYKDGSVIGNGQYYSAGNNADDQLNADSSYYVVMETEDGAFLRTCTSAIQLRSSLNVALAPNPVNSGGTMELFADFPKDELETMNLSIHNLNGMLIKQMKSNSKSTSITLPYNLEMGVYILKIETKNIRKSLKFIIK